MGGVSGISNAGAAAHAQPKSDVAQAKAWLSSLGSDEMLPGILSGDHNFLFDQPIGPKSTKTMLSLEKAMVFIMKHRGKPLPEGFDVKKLSGQFDRNAALLVSAYIKAFPQTRLNGQLTVGYDKNEGNEVGKLTATNVMYQLQKIVDGK